MAKKRPQRREEVPPPMIAGIPWTPSQIKSIDKDRPRPSPGSLGARLRWLFQRDDQGAEDQTDDADQAQGS